MAYINYLLLDATRMDGLISEAIELNETYASLFSPKLAGELKEVAPYLFSYRSDSEFARWFMRKGWGKGWGIMLRSHASPNDLLAHCRRFMLTLDDQEIYFRYFDPRVLPIFLPTCSGEQLNTFFGPIDYFMLETDDAKVAKLIWIEESVLCEKEIDLNELERRLQTNLPRPANAKSVQIKSSDMKSRSQDENYSQASSRSVKIKSSQSTGVKFEPPNEYSSADDYDPNNGVKWNKFFFEE
jgi:hypothetical protein